MAEPNRERKTAALAAAEAEKAWAMIQKACAELRSEGEQAKYATLVRKLPARLLSNGLGPTMAFLFSKGDLGGKKKEGASGAGMLYRQLAEVVEGEAAGRDPGRAMGRIVAMDLAAYRETSRRLLALSQWMKRFADGIFAEETGDDR